MEAMVFCTASTVVLSAEQLDRASARAKPAMKVQAARQPARALPPQTRVKMGPTARSIAHNAYISLFEYRLRISSQFCRLYMVEKIQKIPRLSRTEDRILIE